MKLMTLNLWGGTVQAPLLEFIRKHQDVKIFCFQEVYHRASGRISTDERVATLDIMDQIQALLPGYQLFFQPIVGQGYGMASLIHPDIEVVQEEKFWVYENLSYPGYGADHSRMVQWMSCVIEGRLWSILNFHGLWNGQGKTDSPDRLDQSRRLRALMNFVERPLILCGDFNLRPDSQSFAILKEDMRDLGGEAGVTSTRTSFYPKAEKFADYILVSPEVVVREFAVLPDEVSDHAPLYLEFETA